MTLNVPPYKIRLDAGNAYWVAQFSQLVYVKKSDHDESPNDDKILAKLRALDNDINKYFK